MIACCKGQDEEIGDTMIQIVFRNKAAQRFFKVDIDQLVGNVKSRESTNFFEVEFIC